jgi:hypothetical protein
MPDLFETQVEQHARSFRYPPTPDLVTVLRGRHTSPARRRLRTAAWAGAVIVLLVSCSLLFAPGVRAQILEFLQIGAIRVFFGESTPTHPAPQATANATETDLPSLIDILPGSTTLADARLQAGFAINLPAPETLGEPDEVYVLETGSPVVLLVWNPQENPPQPRTSLFIFGPGNFAGKKVTGAAQSAEVNGREALWITEPHPFEFYNPQQRQVVSYYVAEHVLLWWDEENLTYRLEGSFSLEEALEIANSIR